MTRKDFALAVTLGLIGLIVLGAVSGTAGLMAALSRSDDQEPALAAAPPPAPRDVLLSGESEAIAASALQAALRDAAQRTGVRLTRIEMRPPEQTGGPLAALIEARGVNDQIVRFLYGLESGMPAIITHEARITRAAPLDSGEPAPELIVSAEFHAWRGRAGGGS